MQPLGDQPEEVVGGEMAAAIVHRLELVEVEQQQRDCPPPAPAEPPVGHVVEAGAVGSPVRLSLDAVRRSASIAWRAVTSWNTPMIATALPARTQRQGQQVRAIVDRAQGADRWASSSIPRTRIGMHRAARSLGRVLEDAEPVEDRQPPGLGMLIDRRLVRTIIRSCPGLPPCVRSAPAG